VSHHNETTSTDLYLVRVWRGRPGESTPALHGKIQHVVSGASCLFEGLSGLPDALAKMMAYTGGPHGSPGEDSPDERSDEGPDGYRTD
jgi:hypothetical protein